MFREKKNFSYLREKQSQICMDKPLHGIVVFYLENVWLSEMI
jgi:hypothetical protein